MDVVQPKTKKLPYFEREAICPICGNSSVHYFLRDRTYIIEERDEDYFISKYHWTKPEFNKFSIYTFNLWYCIHCHFVDERNIFFQKKIKEGRSLFDYLKKALKSQVDTDPVIQKLVQYIEYPTHNFLTTLNIHLLAAYIHSLPDPLYQHHEKIAKHYLRTAWLFRLGTKRPQDREIDTFLNEYGRHYTHLQSHIMNALATLEELNQTVVNQNKKNCNYPQWQLDWSKFDEEFQESYRTMSQGMDTLISTLKRYHDIGRQLRAIYLSANRSVLNLPFLDHDEYRFFLEELRQNWPDVPMDEKSALKKAVEHFQKLIGSKTYETDHFKLFNLYNLIIVLNEKIGDYNAAFYYCGVLYDSLKLVIKSTKKQLDRLKITKDTTINPQLLQRTINRSEEMYKDVVSKWNEIRNRKLAVDNEKAKILFNQNRGCSVEALNAKMEQEGIEKSIISKFLQELKKEKKKGILQIFKF